MVTNTLMPYSRVVQYLPGDYIVRQGDKSNAMFVVRTGAVTIALEDESTGPVVVGTKVPGDMIGEIGLLKKQGTRTASIFASEPTTLFVIEEAEFWKALREDYNFQDMVFQSLIGQLSAADHQLVSSVSQERVLVENFTSLSTEHERMAELMKLRKETIDFIIHDLRNPLNLVQMALKLLAVGKHSEEDLQKFILMANGGVERMLGLIDAMLDVEKLESGEAIFDMEVVQIEDVMAKVVERLAPLGIASRIEVTSEPDEDLPPVEIDRHRVDRVFTNLVDNALKFTPQEGKITLLASVYKKNKKFLRLAVNDTGPGIPEDARERIFGRFAQTEAGRKAKGFGLGLSFCKGTIDHHGGEIWIEDGQDGIGTQFVFTLPIAE